MTRLLYGLVALGLLVGGVGEAKAQLDYVFTTIDVPGSDNTVGNGINDAGQIVGWYEAGGMASHGFLYNGASYTTLLVPGSSGRTAWAVLAVSC